MKSTTDSKVVNSKVVNSKVVNSKVVNIQPAKSIIRYAWVRMRQEGAVKLADKKRVFVNVLSESKIIKPWVKAYMIKKANSMRSNAAFDQYLVNSKNYFEKNFVTYER